MSSSYSEWLEKRSNTRKGLPVVGWDEFGSRGATGIRGPSGSTGIRASYKYDAESSKVYDVSTGIATDGEVLDHIRHKLLGIDRGSKIDAVAVHEPVHAVETLEVPEDFKQRGEIAGFYESAVLDTYRIYSGIRMNSTASVLSFSEELFSRYREVSRQASNINLSMADANLFKNASDLFTMLKGMDAENFMGDRVTKMFIFRRAKPWTYEDMFNKFERIRVTADALVDPILTDIAKIKDSVSYIDSVKSSRKELIAKAERYIAAGLCAINDDKSGEHKQQVELIEDKIHEIKKLTVMLEISINQGDLMLRGLVDRVVQMQGLVTAIYPMWKESFTTALNRAISDSQENMGKAVSIENLSGFYESHTQLPENLLEKD